MRKGLLSQESIQFQGDMFFRELAAAYGELKKLKTSEMNGSEEAVTIEKIIKHHTGRNKDEGLTVKMNVTMYGPSVDIPDVHKSQPLMNTFRQSFFDNVEGNRLIAAAPNNEARGSVNLKTGAVKGVFSKISNTIYMPAFMVKSSKYTAEELAAITLHEVGHLFVYFEFIARMVTTNQVLAGIARGMDKSSNQAERETILISAKKALNLTDTQLDQLAKSNNTTAVNVVVVRNIIQVHKSELGSNIYDSNNWEYLADEYATRHGAGRALVTSLDKIYRDFGHMSFKSNTTFLFTEALKVVCAILLVALAVVGGVPGLQASMYFGILLMFWASADGIGDPLYDRPGVRLKRARNQLVERLKNKDLPTNENKAIQEDLAVIDGILAAVEDKLPLFSRIALWFSPNGRDRLDAEKLQQELETLAMNDLFVASAKMKTAA